MKKRIKTLEITATMVFIAFLVAVLLYFLYDFFLIKRPSYIDYFCVELTDNWKFTDSKGESIDVSIPCKIDIPTGESCTFSTVLPDNIEDDYYFSTMVSRDTIISIDGVLRETFIPSNYNEIPGGIAKSVFIYVKLSSADSGKTVSVYKFSDDKYNGNFKRAFVGDIYGIFRCFFEETGIPFILSVVLLVVSIFLSLSCLCYLLHKKGTLNITHFCYGLFFLSAWLFFDSDCFQVLFDRIFIDGFMSYICLIMVPFPFLKYLNAIQKKRYNTYISVLEVISVVCVLIFTLLHVMDIRSFGENLAIIDASLGVVSLLGVITIVYDFFVKKNRENIFFLTGFTVFLLLGMLEIVLINYTDNRVDGIFVILGLYLLVLFCFIQQISELHSIEREKQEALAANASKTQFLANMSHEIRTPINSIIGMNEIILRENKDKKISEYSTYIKKSCSLLLNIVNDILDFSKIESGKVDIMENPYMLSDIVNDMISLLKERASSKNLQVNINVSPNLPSQLLGDDFHIKQIITNLISNAVKYTAEGSVSFEISYENNDVKDICLLKIKVSDTGIGIKEENIDKLFDSFTRIDISKNRNIEGTGLGLSIVKKLLDLMNGSVNVSSVYGSGSTFTVLIPQRVIDSKPLGNILLNKPTDEYKDIYQESFKAPNANILIVDDNKMNLLIAKKLLEKTEVNVDMAYSADESFALAKSKKYDLILMDHMMPEKDGIEAMHMIRECENAASKDTKIIVLTANAISGMKDYYLNEGFCDYLTKPIDPKLLEQAISNHLDESLVKRS